MKWGKSRQPLKLGALFAFVVFFIISVSNTLLAIIVVMLFNRGVLYVFERNFISPVIMTLIVSIIIGTILSIIVGKRFLSPIFKINKATMEVSKGNFNIRIDENPKNAQEIGEMIKNFNIMVSELNNIETFRNDFIANVSHEFKTPLSAIEGYTMLLQDKSLTNEERDIYLAKIISGTRRLSTLSENILKISKLENQKIILDKKKFKLDEQIRQAILLFESKWGEKNIDLIIKLEPVIFYGDEELIMQIWTNLIGNAIKFTGDNGVIKISLKKNNGNVVADISDNGIGMSDETQKYIFEKFYQGDRSHSGEGNGLGLALVKKILELYDGDIKVKSELGSGSQFTVNIPSTWEED